MTNNLKTSHNECATYSFKPSNISIIEAQIEEEDNRMVHSKKKRAMLRKRLVTQEEQK